MAETIPPGATPGDAATAAAPAESMAAYVAPAPLSVKALIEAGAHFGHQTHRWNPKMKNFIFGERNGIHIVDLDQTLERFRGALDFLRKTTANGGKVLFVGTKRQAAIPVQSESARAGQLFVNNRWLGGTLTNFRTVKKSLDRFKELLATMENAEEWNALSKKERSGIQRDVDRYRKSLDGLREMTKLPAAIFLIDVKREHIAVAEGRRLGIPIVAVVDTNCDPGGIDFVIPGNDDATRAIQLYCGWVAEACVDGAQLHEAKVRSEASEESGVRRGDGEAHAGGMGRVVVEIKQPPRRGRGARRGPPGSGPGGTRSAGVEHDPEEAAPSAPVEVAEAPAQSE
ncbi:MAG: 30S ribosomal protein S2 [Myxococcota bacterium]|jgi:small subunit ribosomal protein S2|nr:30S ribosomal protein S2 [Myxococcota bacterium]